MSKGSENVKQHLTTLLKKYSIDFETETGVGMNDSGYDFQINTKPPIVIEFDGQNHKKANNHFFKTATAFENYKRNDNIKNLLSSLGKTHLIRIEDEKISYAEFEKLFEGYEELLMKGTTNASKENKESYKEKRNKTAADYRRKKYLEFREKSRINKKNKNSSETETE